MLLVHLLSLKYSNLQVFARTSRGALSYVHECEVDKKLLLALSVGVSETMQSLWTEVRRAECWLKQRAS